MTVTSKLVIPLLLFCLLAQSTAFAAEATPSASKLPTVHILPDNPLYFLKTIKEKVQLLVARNASSQADLLLDFSQKRLAEAQKVAEKGKIHISEKLLEAFGKDIETAQEKINQAKERGEQTRDLLLKLQETIAYQKSVLERLEKMATESGKISTAGLGVVDWLRSLFGKKEILSPLVE